MTPDILATDMKIDDVMWKCEFKLSFKDIRIDQVPGANSVCLHCDHKVNKVEAF